MQPDETRIKLGTRGNRQTTSATNTKPESGAAAEPGPAVFGQPGKAGYSLESDRRFASKTLEDQKKAQNPVVRPWILVCFIGAIAFLIVVVIVRAHGPESIGYNNQEILNQYAHYMIAQPDRRLPSKEEVRAELNAIAYLEDTGRNAEARDAWAEIILKTEGDRDNPLYAIGMTHLENLNRRLDSSQ
jgi:hypothetical protein